ncbi:MAG: molecular chaperone TorD family protein [Pseudazoarcus pumilus]|nr:molecular chaperone TorD family protein [Pseudazoarcus pumilus]
MLENTVETPRDTDVDMLRAGTWTLLGRLLMAPPDRELRERMIAIGSETRHGDAISEAWGRLAEAARTADDTRLAEEYQTLFIGVGSGEVTPYSSWYLDESIASRPLVLLRDELVRLGIERRADSSETEDHAGAVCEIMGFVVLDEDVDFDWQKEIFERHVDNWMGRLFEDIDKAPGADFYRAVAALGSAFLTLERRFYAMSA